MPDLNALRANASYNSRIVNLYLYENEGVVNLTQPIAELDNIIHVDRVSSGAVLTTKVQ